MPSVVNGCGTWYWGKRDRTTREGYCESCNRLVMLESYDTSHCIVVLFLPIIPLGKKHIIDSCPVCTKHRAVPQKQWEAMKQEAISESLEAWRRNKDDLDAAKRVIGSAVFFHDKATFYEVTSGVANRASDDAEFMALLGSAYEHFDDLQPMEESLRQSLAIKHDPQVRNLLIDNLLRQNRPDDAWPFLEEIIQAQEKDGCDLVRIAVEVFQSQGKHDNAIYVIRAAFDAFPELSSDRKWKRLKKRSEKRYTSGKPIKSLARTPTKNVNLKPSNPWAITIGKCIMPALLLLGVIAFLNASHQAGEQREVHIVNGLPIPYTASIAGQSVKLPALGHRSIKIPEGDLHVHVDEPDLNIADQTCHFETGFWGRLFTDHLVIINPDRSAILTWEKSQYAVNPNSAEEGSYEIHTGKLLTTFTDIDFPFQKFPNQIDLPEGKPQWRESVQFVSDIEPADTFAVLTNRAGDVAATEYLLRLPLREPHEESTATLLLSSLPLEDLPARLEPLLDDVPVRVEAHRLYQNTVGRVAPERDLEAEYQQRLTDHPDDPALMYLYGRTHADPEKARALFERAANANPPCVRALSAIAYDAQNMAQFERALEATRTAISLDNQTYSFYATEMQMLLALKRHDELLKRLEDPTVVKTIPDLPRMQYEVLALVSQERFDVLDERIKAMEVELKDLDAETRDLWLAAFRAQRYYASGDWEKQLAAVEPVDSAEYAFGKALHEHDYTAAADAWRNSNKTSCETPLLLYADALIHQPDQAQTCLDLAIPALREAGRNERRVADWLEGDELTDAHLLLQLAFPGQRKLYCLTALAARFPEQRTNLIELAEKLNFDRSFPHDEIAAILTALKLERADSSDATKHPIGNDKRNAAGQG